MEAEKSFFSFRQTCEAVAEQLHSHCDQIPVITSSFHLSAKTKLWSRMVALRMFSTSLAWEKNAEVLCNFLSPSKPCATLCLSHKNPIKYVCCQECGKGSRGMRTFVRQGHREVLAPHGIQQLLISWSGQRQNIFIVWKIHAEPVTHVHYGELPLAHAGWPTWLRKLISPPGGWRQYMHVQMCIYMYVLYKCRYVLVFTWIHSVYNYKYVRIFYSKCYIHIYRYILLGLLRLKEM